MLFDEVHSFARDFINEPSFRTYTRKKKIKEAYFLLTGEKIKTSCSTCYVEALLKIINSTKVMTPKGYELKKGVLLQAFGDASKTVTNDTLTDEIAEWYLTNQPEKIIYFSKVGTMTIPSAPPANITIIQPKKEHEINDVAEAIIAGATELKEKEPIKPEKKEVKPRKTKK
jgi:hypothetical protein